MTHSYMCYDSFIHMRVMTHSYVCHDSWQQVAAAMEGRGGGRGDRYQGRCTKVSARAQAAAAANEAIALL